MTPEELEKLPKPLEHTMTSLELSIMEEIVQRIKETAQITPVTDWLISRLMATGQSKSRIKKLIGDAIRDADLQIDQIYDKAARSNYVRDKSIYKKTGKDYKPYEENEWLQQVVDVARRQTQDSIRPFENITQTTGFNVSVSGGKKVFTPLSEYLERSLDRAMMGIATGAKTYSQAINEVIDEMTSSGVRVVDYASGKSDRIEVAVRRAIMTGVAQMTDKINEKNGEVLGTDHWEVDWHAGARNTGTGYMNHQSWQGKVYSSEEMRTVCGLGEMLGFAGINCYHIRSPFIVDVSKRRYTDEWLEEQNRKENEKKTFRGREYDTYKALQRQRALERTIRKQKQDVELLERAGADKDSITTAKCRLQLTNKTYTDFSKTMKLPQQRERLYAGKLERTFATRKAPTFLDTMRIRLPEESLQIQGMTPEIRSRIEQAIDQLQSEYQIKLSGVFVDAASRNDIFVSGPYMDGDNMRFGLVLNSRADYTKIVEMAQKRYVSGLFAGKSIEDYVSHEMAHIMTFQGCSTPDEYWAMKKTVDRLFVPGISRYADQTGLGSESLAEAFVRYRNGEQIPQEAKKKYIDTYIERWKK